MRIETLDRPAEIRLGPWLIGLALALLALDVLATLVVSGRLRRGAAARRAQAAGVALLARRAGARRGPGRGAGGAGRAREALYAANQTVLAYVVTGNPRVDAISAAGLKGLSRALFDRTAIEPADPVAVDIETHDISLYPFLYWPITEAQPAPSDAAVAKINDFLRFGGMILFDTQDADLGGAAGATTPNGRVLQRIAAQARRAAAGAGAARPRADPHLLSAAGLSRPLGRLAGLGRGLARGRGRSRACRSATSTTG